MTDYKIFKTSVKDFLLEATSPIYALSGTKMTGIGTEYIIYVKLTSKTKKGDIIEYIVITGRGIDEQTLEAEQYQDRSKRIKDAIISQMIINKFKVFDGVISASDVFGELPDFNYDMITHDKLIENKFEQVDNNVSEIVYISKEGNTIISRNNKYFISKRTADVKYFFEIPEF